MYRKLMARLEEENYPLFGPTLKVLKFFGLWKPDSCNSIFYWKYLGTTWLTLFVVTQYIQLWVIRKDLNNALANLSLTMLSTICSVKACTFIKWEKKWKDVIKSMSAREVTDVKGGNNAAIDIMKKYIHYARFVTFFYWLITSATIIALVLTPFFKILSSSDYRYMLRNGTEAYPEVLSSWFPFDNDRSYGYWVSYFIQSTACLYGSLVVAMYDTNAVSVMIYFAGQLRVLREMCTQIYGGQNNDVSDSEALDRIRSLSERHSFLIKYSYIYNSLLSPVMFFYVITVSLMICASTIRITLDGTSKMQQLWIAEYVIALVFQLFLYCWHSHEVLAMSESVHCGVYESMWWSRNVRLRRSTLLLQGKLQKEIKFTAGPFTVLTLNTFITIMKGSYSYYTLLRNEKD